MKVTFYSLTEASMKKMTLLWTLSVFSCETQNLIILKFAS